MAAPSSWCLLKTGCANFRLLARSCSSTTKGPLSSQPLGDSTSSNSNISPEFHNRNPRNLEQLTIARKPKGYHLEKTSRSYWNKLRITVGNKSITAEVIHQSGVSVVSASSSEYALKKHLYRYTDTCAFKAVGQVLAQRCLESGISAVFCDLEPDEGTKMDILLKELENGGLSLTEPPEYRHPGPWDRYWPVKPWTVQS